jgi:hypothetical protein
LAWAVLNAASQSLTGDNMNGALNQLNAFVNEVNAQKAENKSQLLTPRT